jgi:hypothetical protein
VDRSCDEVVLSRVDRTVRRVSRARFRNLQNRETLTLYAYAFTMLPACIVTQSRLTTEEP